MTNYSIWNWRISFVKDCRVEIRQNILGAIIRCFIPSWVRSSSTCSVIINLLSSVVSCVTLPLTAWDIAQDRRLSLIYKPGTNRLQRNMKSSPKMCHEKAMTTNSRLEAVSSQGCALYRTWPTWSNHVLNRTIKIVHAINKIKLLRFQASRRITMEIEKATI